MSDLAYEKLATRARDLLNVQPRPATDDVARQILHEIAKEFQVPAMLHERFAERLSPALVQIVSNSRSKLVREIEEEAIRPYLAKPLPRAESPAMEVTESSGGSPASALGDGHVPSESHLEPAVPSSTPASGGQRRFEAHGIRAALPESGEGDQDQGESHCNSVAPPAPQVDGHDAGEAHDSSAVPAERSDEAANPVSKPNASAPLVTPLSLRAEVFDGFRALRNELLYVPEYEDVTYGSATAEQRQRAMTYYHSMAGGYMAKSRRMRVIDEAIKAAGAATLGEMLNGQALAGRES